ncbi:MAG: GTP pyrophosphokinase family protein [Bifidobacteriaceae bacterium]|jgi:putative GTP pyrophosphokinase|nr:GTP pyrophosphokinase family protein [Bifidobacteriaceae bacterium]
MQDEAFKAATAALFADDRPDPGLQDAAIARLGAAGQELREQFVRLMVSYKAGINEVLTKISILSDEFAFLHQSNPIEHVTHRLKSPQSMLEKLVRKGVEPSFKAIQSELTDIAGVRVTCSFIADTYRVCEALLAQDDVTVLQTKDYIKAPKPNGYRSLHAIVQVPVFLSDGPTPVSVEVQIRTIAMDFWASLEHKIFYKYKGDVPPELVASLTDAAETACELDQRMERLYDEIRGGHSAPGRPLGVDDAAVKAFQSLLRSARGTPVG